MMTAEIQDYLNFKTKIFEIAFGKNALNQGIADIKVIEKMQENAKKYSISQIFEASSIVREQMSENQLDSDDVCDTEFEAMVEEILKTHWDFKTYEKRLEIVTTDNSAIYAKVKKMAGMEGGQAENEILDGICKNTLGDQPMFDELESYLIPETYEAELMEAEL
jgi:hypothetical protein